MAFQLKNFVSIVASMVNHVRGVQSDVTDFNPGSVVRTILEAPAIEIDELYQRTFDGIRQAIPVATFNSFNFERLNAQPAGGTVLVTVSSSASARLVPAGSVFSSPAARTTYLSQIDVTIAAGATTASILVAAAEPGVIGNIPASVAFTVYPVISGLVSAANAVAFLTGADLETDEQRKQRFTQYITTLQRATGAALIYGAKTVRRYDTSGGEVERVASAAVVEPYEVDPGSNAPGYINLYIHNGVGSTSADLVTRTTEVIKGYTDATTGEKVAGWKAAGVAVTIAAASEVTVAVTATLTAKPGYSSTALATAASAVISDYLRSLDIAASYLESELVYRVKSITGVLNITGTPADVVPTSSQKIMPGTIAVTGA